MRSAIWILILAQAANTGAQTVRLMPDLAIAESEYRDAEEAWLKNDPNLTRDLFKANPEDMRRRIRRTAGLRDEVMVKKEVYLASLVKRFDDVKTRLVQNKDANLPTDQLKESLNREQARLLSDQEQLELRIGDIPSGDEYSLVRRAMEAERTELLKLQNNVALRIRSLDRAGAAQKAIPGYAEPLEAKLDDLRTIWEGERVRTVKARNAWARLYRDLEGSLDGKTGPDLRTKLGLNRPASQPTSVIQTGLKPGSRAMDGAWVYRSQPGAWVGAGEPDTVALRLRKTGDRIEGTYVARLPVRNDLRSLNLALQGQMISERQARVQWSSQKPPAHGDMLLKLGLDGRLLVQRLKSDDSYIPKGMEVLLPQ